MTQISKVKPKTEKKERETLRDHQLSLIVVISLSLGPIILSCETKSELNRVSEEGEASKTLVPQISNR